MFGHRRALLQAPVEVVASAYTAVAVNFDGTNDWLSRGAGLTGAANSKLLSGSFWFKSGANGGTRRILSTSSSVGGADNLNCRIFKGSSNNELDIQMSDASNVQSLRIAASASSLAVAAGWVHCLFSVDMADTGKRHLYIDDVSDLATVTTYIDVALDFTHADWAIMGSVDGASKVSGDLSEFWFAPGQYIDFSVEANRRKFIDASGKPVSLGADGSTPTGVAPLIYFANELTTWQNNLGTGEGFTENGALTSAATSPSD